MDKLKKIICLILAFVMVLAAVPYQNNVYAASNNKYTYDFPLGKVSGITFDMLKSVYGLPSYLTQSITKNGKTLSINKELWIDKRIAVYGDFTTIFVTDAKNDKKVKVGAYYSGYEYRYHGYTREWNLFTNEQFPNDTQSTPPFAERTYIYKWWEEKGQKISDFNSLAINKNDSYYQNLINHSINDRIARSTNLTANKTFDGGFYNTYEHGLILSMATTLFNGAIRLFRRTSKGDFYQTFSTNTLINKKQAPFTLDIEILNKDNIEARGETLVQLSIKYTAILKDGAYINQETDKYKYYTREDIKFNSERLTLTNGGSLNASVSMKESTTISGDYAFTGIVKTKVKSSELAKGITVNGTAAIEYNGGSGASATDSDSITVTKKLVGIDCKYSIDNIFLKTTDTFSADMVQYVDMSIGDIVRYDFDIEGQSFSSYGTPDKDSIQKYIYNNIKDEVHAGAEGQSFTYNTKQIVYDDGGNKSEYTAIFNITKQGGGAKQPIRLNAFIDNNAFDIVPFRNVSYSIGAVGAGDAPQGELKEKYVTIDGLRVDFDYFFSKNFTFAEVLGESDYNRPVFVRAVMESQEGVESYYERWVTVYTTKPKAQLHFEGQTRVNRKVTILNDSKTQNLNDPNLYEKYSFDYTYELIGAKYKSFDKQAVSNNVLYKQEGFYQVKLTASVNIYDAKGGARVRTSEPYILSYYVLPDYKPNAIFNIWNNVLVRGEKLEFTLDVQSLDGDEISKHEVIVKFDADLDGIYETEIIKTNYADIDTYSWVFDRLGNYRITSYAEERFDDTTTIPDLLDGSEKVSVTTQRDFFVDNLRPIVNIDVDLPVNLQSVDVFVMESENIDRALDTELKTEKVNYANSIRLFGVDAIVSNWDLHTYIYSQSVSMSNSTGGTYPSNTYYYSSGGYTGTLNRTSVANNPYTVNNGYYTNEQECHTESVWTGSYLPCSACCTDTEDCAACRYWNVGCGREYVNQTVCNTVRVWHDSYSTYDSYTGYYSGTVSKPVKQTYTNPFRQNSDKYVIFVGDNNTISLTDYNMVKAQAAFKTIFIGKKTDQNKFENLDYFVDINSNTLAQAMAKAIKHIGSSYAMASEYLMIEGAPFSISELLFDTEGDTITNIGYQYVQKNVFDNPEARENFSRSSFSNNIADFINYKATTLNSVGKHTIYRLVKDDTTQGDKYNLESNLASVSILVHRKPIALCTLDWDYNSNTNKYITTWVDQSYDLDHNISRADKGIIDRKIMFRQDSGEWQYYIPDTLDAGHSYALQYTVKDVEGVWSDPFNMTFMLSDMPSIQFEAKVKTELDVFSMNSVPASENLLAYDIWTRYPYEHYVKCGFYKSNQYTDSLHPEKGWDIKDFINWGEYSTGNDRYWKDMLLNISETTQDGDYKLFMRAECEQYPEYYRELAFEFTVMTPINLLPHELESLQGADINTLNAETSKYASKVNVILFKGTEYECAFEMKCIELDGLGVGEKIWEISMEIAADIPEGSYDIEYIAETPNGNVEKALQQTVVRQIGLENLRISKVFDPSWCDVGIKPVSKMPVYKNAGKPIKLGYAVELKIDSINLDNPMDEIIIKYSYYVFNNGNLNPVEIYVMNDKKRYINIKESVYADTACVNIMSRGKPSINAKTLENGRCEWTFSIFLPWHSKFTRSGEKLELWSDNVLKGELLVCAEIIGVQKRVEEENTIVSAVKYNEREANWALEAFIEEEGCISKPSGRDILGYGANNGELFWYNLDLTAFDDVRFQREW